MSLFSNPILLIAIVLGFGGIAYYFILFLKPTKKVLLLRPRDRRGKELKVIQETEIGLFCKGVKDVTYRFFKFGPSWIFNKGGRMTTQFFGIEGTAYIGLVRDVGEVKVSVKELLEFLWGEEFYAGIPQTQRTKVETDVLGITIEIDKVDEEEAGLPVLTASDINDENENVVLGKLTPKKKGSTGDTIMKTVMAFLLGAFLMYFVRGQGYI